MVKLSRGRPGSAVKKSPGSAGKKSPGQQLPPVKPLNTSKGQFTFTMVTDGCYIEHKWGQNSGHVGVPLEAIPGFIQRLQALYTKTTGQQVSAKSPGAGKSPAGKSPGGGPKGIGKGKKTKVVKVTKKEKPKKMTTEELDNDLMSYTSARGDAAETPAEGAA